MGTDRQQGNQQGNDDGHGKIPPLEFDPVGVFFEPATQKIPAQRKGNERGQDNQERKLPRQHTNQIRDRGAQHFTNANLLGSLLGSEGGQSE